MTDADLPSWNAVLPRLYEPTTPTATMAMGVHFRAGGVILVLGFYVPNLFVVEALRRGRRGGTSVGARRLAVAVQLVATGFLLLGTYFFTVQIWAPAISQRFASRFVVLVPGDRTRRTGPGRTAAVHVPAEHSTGTKDGSRRYCGNVRARIRRAYRHGKRSRGNVSGSVRRSRASRSTLGWRA